MPRPRLIRDRFTGDALGLAEVMYVLGRRASIPPRYLTFLLRTGRGRFGVAILPTGVDSRTRDGMLAVAVALHFATRPGTPPLHYVDGDPLFDPARAERARQFAIAFIGGAAVRRKIA